MNRSTKVLLSVCCSALLVGCELDAVFNIDVADLARGGNNQIAVRTDIIMPMSGKIECLGLETAALVDRFFDDADVEFCAMRVVRTITSPDGRERTEESLDRDSPLRSGNQSRKYADADGNGVSENRYAVAVIEGTAPLAFDGSRPEGFFSLTSERNSAGESVSLRLFIDGDKYSDMLYGTGDFSNATSKGPDGRDYASIDVGEMEISLFNSTDQECRVTVGDGSSADRSVLNPGATSTYRISTPSKIENGTLVSAFTEGIDALQVEGCL